MPLESWIQHSRHDMFLYDWQTLIAGVFALAAAAGTIWVTIRSANREVAASQKQTRVAQKQIETTIRLERRRAASEGYAFHSMVLAAMKRVLEEADEVKKLVFGFSPTDEPSEQAYEARTHFTKLAFTELRAACVTYGGRLTEEFLELETKIDKFASKTEQVGTHKRVGKHKDLDDELAVIVAKAAHLRDEAAAGMERANVVFTETDAADPTLKAFFVTT